MRFFIALAGAVAGALLMSLFVANPAATWVVRQFAFESPDQVSDLHSSVFMGLNVLGLLVGWSAGFLVGKALSDPSADDPDASVG